MKKEKGISKMGVIIILALVIIAAIYGAKYFGTPVTKVMMQGMDHAKDDLEKANQANDTMNRATDAANEAVRKANQANDAINK